MKPTCRFEIAIVVETQNTENSWLTNQSLDEPSLVQLQNNIIDDL